MDKFVKRLIRKHRTNCPFTIAENLKITVLHLDLGKITKGFFHRRLRRNYIVLHQELTDMQQRFTCAHELGHFFFDRGTSYFMLEQNTLQLPGKYERRANQFAVELLMPDELIRQSGGDTMTVHEAAAEYGVPPELAFLKRKGS